MDVQSIMDAGINGFWISSTMKLLFQRGSFSSIFSKQNLENSAKIGVAQVVYNQVGRPITRSIVGRMSGGNAK